MAANRILICVFLLIFIAAIVLNKGKSRNPRVIYGIVQDGMVSVKACGEVLYLHKTIRQGILRPIPDNVHDMLFFPVTAEDLESFDVAIVTYNPWYPPWAQAEPVFYRISYTDLNSGWSQSEYAGYINDIKCMIIGNGLFSKQYSDYELRYWPLR